MSPFRFIWVQKFIRKYTGPIPEERAAQWKGRLSFVYMLCAWNALGFLLFMFYREGKGNPAEYYGLKTDEDINKKPAVYYSELLGLKKTHVIEFKRFTKVNEYDYVAKEKERLEDEKEL